MYTVICDPLKRKLLAASAAASTVPRVGASTSSSATPPPLHPCLTYLRCFAAVHDVLMNEDGNSSSTTTKDKKMVLVVAAGGVEDSDDEAGPKAPICSSQLLDLIEGWSLVVADGDEEGCDGDEPPSPTNHHHATILQRAENILIDMCSSIVSSFLIVKEEHDECLIRHHETLASNNGRFVSGMGESSATISSRFNVVKRVIEATQQLQRPSVETRDQGPPTIDNKAPLSHSNNNDDDDEGTLTKNGKLHQSVRWAARHLLDSILGLHTLKEKAEAMPSMNPNGDSIPSLAGMMYVLCNLWESDKVADRFDRAVIESWERPTREGPPGRSAFGSLLQFPTKAYAVSRACSAFCFALYALMTSPKTQFLDILPFSLEVSGEFFRTAKPAAAITSHQQQQHHHQPTTSGLLSNLLKIKASYDDVENPSERLWKHRHNLSRAPHQTIRMMLRQVSRLLRAHTPEFMAILDIWASIPAPQDEVNQNQYEASSSSDKLQASMSDMQAGGDALLVDGCRSWFETLFGVPNVPRTAANIYEAEQRDSAGATSLLGPSDRIIFWTHFTAFGWPFVMKLALQIITEAFSVTSQIPTLEGTSVAMYGRGLQILSPNEGNAASPLQKSSKNDRFAEIVRRSNMVRDTPSEHLPISPFGPYMKPPEKSDGTSSCNKRLHAAQRSLVSTINLLPLGTVDFEGCVRRSDQWDAALFFNMKHSSGGDSIDPAADMHMKAWETQFVSASIANSKADSERFNITKSVDKMCLRW